jgi:hypothetical protein
MMSHSRSQHHAHGQHRFSARRDGGLLVGATIHARRIGNERRDVAFLGVVASLCSVGTAVLYMS